LKSLQIALELAIGASNDIERKIHDMAPNTNNSTVTDKARKALDTVKRISAETSALSDKIQVHVEEVNGIVYWVDDDSNVYSQEDVYLGKKDPRVIAKITDALGDDGFTPIRAIMCTHEIV